MPGVNFEGDNIASSTQSLFFLCTNFSAIKGHVKFPEKNLVLEWNTYGVFEKLKPLIRLNKEKILQNEENEKIWSNLVT